jgi:hypothetical protein
VGSEEYVAADKSCKRSTSTVVFQRARIGYSVPPAAGFDGGLPVAPNGRVERRTSASPGASVPAAPRGRIGAFAAAPAFKERLGTAVSARARPRKKANANTATNASAILRRQDE